MTQIAPQTVGTIGALVLEQDSGTANVSAQAAFSGLDLLFALDAAPAGVAIDAGSGLVTIGTAQLIAAAPVVVRASNSAGSATVQFTVTVQSSSTVFNAPAKLSDVGFLGAGAAASWTYHTDGFARLVPGENNDRVHGNWVKARGDGLYRSLVRWNAPVTPHNDRSIYFTARLTQSAANFSGIRVDVFENSPHKKLGLRTYVGFGLNTTTTTTLTTGWSWNAWHWLEVEIDGTSVKARFYPEGAAAPPGRYPGPQPSPARVRSASGGRSSGGEASRLDVRIDFVPWAITMRSCLRLRWTPTGTSSNSRSGHEILNCCKAARPARRGGRGGMDRSGCPERERGGLGALPATAKGRVASLQLRRGRGADTPLARAGSGGRKLRPALPADRRRPLVGNLGEPQGAHHRGDPSEIPAALGAGAWTQVEEAGATGVFVSSARPRRRSRWSGASQGERSRHGGLPCRWATVGGGLRRPVRRTCRRDLKVSRWPSAIGSRLRVPGRRPRWTRRSSFRRTSRRPRFRCSRCWCWPRCWPGRGRSART